MLNYRLIGKMKFSKNSKEGKLLNQNKLKSSPTSLFQAMLWVEAREPVTGYRQR